MNQDDFIFLFFFIFKLKKKIHFLLFIFNKFLIIIRELDVSFNVMDINNS